MLYQLFINCSRELPQISNPTIMQILEQGQYVGHILKEQSANGILSSVSCYNQNLFNDNGHCHLNPHISFVLKGGCSEKKKDKYKRLPGRITFYQAGEPHQIIRMHHSIHVNLEMNDAFFLQSGFEVVTFEKTLHKTLDAKFLMLQVYRELAADDSFSHTSIQILLLEYLSRAECWQEQKKVPEWLKKVHEAMNDCWSETLTLNDLSSAAGVHPVTISAYFPRYFSCTFGAYMRKLRVERALQLMKIPDMKLTDIAYSCGFFDQSHFTRTFKELTGFLPAHYHKI
jgi:AraC family transcriptional regulator